MKELKENLKSKFSKAKDKVAFMNEIKEFLYKLSVLNHNPVDLVRWVHIDKIQANDYNPNNVAKNELRLLYTSISHDGYTQPIVTIWDEKIKKYVIVDGFHRYYVQKSNKDLREGNSEYLPIVVIDKPINDRMASTIRHNRARGKHSIDGMSSIVFQMLENGWEDVDICNELGMETDELVRLKHITGFSKLFEDVEYLKAWKTKKQIMKEGKYREEHGETKDRDF